MISRRLSRDATLKATMRVRAGLALLPFHRVNTSSGNGGDVITLIIHIVVIVEDSKGKRRMKFRLS